MTIAPPFMTVSEPGSSQEMAPGQPAVSAAGSKHPLLQVEDLKVHFPVRSGVFSRIQGWVKAVDGVSFQIKPGETLGLVGESGCGKSTLGKAVMRLVQPQQGRILLDGTDITRLQRGALRKYRRRLQMIFQDPYSSLNPRMTAGNTVVEPLLVHKIGSPQEQQERVRILFERVGLSPEQMSKYPHEFSGGQRQRIGIARALALNPQLIVADEPVSALDVSIQAQVINLLDSLQQERGIAYLFISHDLALVRHISHRLAVMYLGRLVEYAPAKKLFAQPQHPYSQALMQAVLSPKPGAARIQALPGEVPSPINPPPGCPFHPRCPHVQDRCRHEIPNLREIYHQHFSACHLAPFPANK